MKGLAGAAIVTVWLAAVVSAQRPTRAPDIFFVPTWEPVVYQMLELANVTKDDVVYDLGSGDGRIVILAAQKYGARGVGIELDPRLVEISRQVARDAQVLDRVHFIEGDLFTSDISAATVVTLFLSSSVNDELEPKLRRELKPGTRIVSHQFGIGKWAPEKAVRAEEDRTNLYLWRVPTPDRLDASRVSAHGAGLSEGRGDERTAPVAGGGVPVGMKLMIARRPPGLSAAARLWLKAAGSVIW